MHNSFSLGLFHGLLFGISPVTPWFIGLQRYVCEGPAKGLLTFAGFFLGNILLLLITFFGGTELLWLWYYIEPACVLCGMVAFFRTLIRMWSNQRLPKRLENRREGFLYLGTGGLWALCNPCGLQFSSLIIDTNPHNPTVYVLGFLLVYTVVAVSLVYLICLSPLGQKCFGTWSIAKLKGETLRISQFFSIHLRNVRIMSTAALLGLAIQWTGVGGFELATFYFDHLVGWTPFERIVPMHNFEWVEDTKEVEPTEDGNDEDDEPKKIFKRQSPIDMARLYENEVDTDMDEEWPWNVVYKYNTLNEDLERTGMSYRTKENELEHYEVKGPSTKLVKRLVKWYEESKLRFEWEPQLEDDTTQKDELTAHWLKELTRIRTEMDEILNAQYGTHNNPRPHLPFTKYDTDYDLNPVAVAEDEEVSEENAFYLKLMLKKFGKTDFFDDTYDMVHRGAEYIDLGMVRLQDLPQEVHFPWDYPLVHAPNVPDILPGIQEEEDETVVETRNTVQNKNAWFLDPIALNGRFVANDPAWTHHETVEANKAADLPFLRAPNTTRRWWLGDDFTSEEDMLTDSQQSAREIIVAKVVPGGPKRP